MFGTSTLTAITAQNTVGVTAVHEVPTDVIAAQIDAVVTDIGADAVKTGMLSSPAIVATVADALRRHGIANLVVDPVMVAKSGDRLLRQEAIATICDDLIPLARVVTPNIPEAEDLTGRSIESDDDVRRAAEAIIGMGAKSVVIKGGHREGPPTDVLYDGETFLEFTAERIPSTSTHGTGCTFASAVAARSGPRTPNCGGGATGQGIRHRRHRRRLSDWARAWAIAPFSCLLAVIPGGEVRIMPAKFDTVSSRVSFPRPGF